MASPPKQMEEDIMEAADSQSRPEWKAHIAIYRHDELAGVRFASDADRDRAIDLFWDPASPLYKVPQNIVDGKTVVLPVEALRYLDAEDISYERIRVVSSADLPPGRLLKLQEEQGHH